MDTSNIATLQPRPKRGPHPLPKPWHIDLTTGKVMRQDYWRGNPMQLIGFTADSTVFEVQLLRDEFAQDPMRAQGMHPIFVTNRGRLWTTRAKIDVHLEAATEAPAEQVQA